MKRIYDMSKPPDENYQVDAVARAIQALVRASADDLRLLSAAACGVEPEVREALFTLAEATQWARETAARMSSRDRS